MILACLCRIFPLEKVASHFHDLSLKSKPFSITIH